MNEPNDLAALRAGLSPGAVDWAIAVSRQCSDATVVMMGPETARLLEAESRRSIEMSTLSLLRHITGLSEVVEINALQVSLADRMARLDLSYQRIVAGQRRIQDIVLESLLDRATHHQPASARPGLLRALTSVVSRFYDENVAGIIEEYLAERQRAIAQTLNDRRRVTRALVAGERVPRDLASHSLGIDLAQHHLALIIWPRDHAGAGNKQGDLESFARQAADALHTLPPLTVPDDSDTGAVLCWLTSPAPFRADHLDVLSDLVDTFHDIRVAIGPPGPGEPGFRRSHLGARDAESVAHSRGHTKTTAYDDIGAVALMSSDPERARWFVTEELGPLAAQDDPTTADLRTTALCFLDCGRSLVRTAAALHVHRNTVVYRLQNVERLLGRSLDDRPFATYAALTLADRVSDAVLGGTPDGP
ncbi:helix-turn-helix domain-containing protein [Streptomyces sp. NPDC048251]|uniref:PucR family transcriptional regulator n=1 Tax=Streptomyces sp. NPDC048251 TaxID=3154501 RepID=UPI0034445422